MPNADRAIRWLNVSQNLQNRTDQKGCQLITFPAATSRRWKLDFKPSKTTKVALRGLHFYFYETELHAAVTSDEHTEPVETKSASHQVKFHGLRNDAATW